MLPSSHSFSGRWTCRSTARIKLRSERFCFFERYGIAHGDRAAVYDASDHATPAHKLVFQAQADLIHAEARFADLRNLEHRTVAQPDSGADRQAHHVQALNREVLLDGARFDAKLVKRFLVGQ